jgi:hypothetical protein
MALRKRSAINSDVVLDRGLLSVIYESYNRIRFMSTELCQGQ